MSPKNKINLRAVSVVSGWHIRIDIFICLASRPLRSVLPIRSIQNSFSIAKTWNRSYTNHCFKAIDNFNTILYFKKDYTKNVQFWKRLDILQANKSITRVSHRLLIYRCTLIFHVLLWGFASQTTFLSFLSLHVTVFYFVLNSPIEDKVIKALLFLKLAVIHKLNCHHLITALSEIKRSSLYKCALWAEI